ncbi:Gaa1-like protein [Chytridium lagenaria]|nr:Gaa1-like protein [Chytridium lagenaria]
MLRRLLFKPKPIDPTSPPPPSTEATQLQRRRVALFYLYIFSTRFAWLLYLLGVTWILLFPLPQLQKRAFIDENALLPGQSRSYFTDADLGVLRIGNGGWGCGMKAEYLKEELQKVGLEASVQKFVTSDGREAANTYAVVRSPRADGTEALVYVAPWVCLNGEVNVNGISLMLAFASFMTKYSHWSKDFVCVFSDAGLEGTHAFLQAYHGIVVTPDSAIQYDALDLYSGVINEAFSFELPGTGSYDRFHLYVEGLNGQQANADVISTLSVISYNFGVQIVLHDDVASRENQALGYPLAHHALFLRYKIEAVSLFAVSDGNPHGGKMSMVNLGLFLEATLRCFNNLLERLHHSFWFYIMCTVNGFIPIVFYIAPVILLASSFLFQSIALWTAASEPKMEKAKISEEIGKTGYLRRPDGVNTFMGEAVSLGLPLMVIGFAYAWSIGVLKGLMEFGVPEENWLTYASATLAISTLAILLIIPLLKLFLHSTPTSFTLLKCLTSPSWASPSSPVPIFFLSTPSKSTLLRLVKLILLIAISPVGLLGMMQAVGGDARGLLVTGVEVFKLYGGWFLPYVVTLYGPLNLVMQGYVVWA